MNSPGTEVAVPAGVWPWGTESKTNAALWATAAWDGL